MLLQPVTALDTFVGRQLGKYQLESLLGRGGMATVYRAHDTVLNRSVAIKILDPTLAIDPRAVERFKREAVTAANLEHPAIVRVYDVQQEGGLHYIAMRYVAGTTLKEILHDNGPLPLEAVLNILEAIAGALHYAHRHGVIHRDVKPGNILVEPDGTVLLTDFGIARAADNSMSGLTATGLVMGTADYLAPEQISGRPAEPRSDIYSLGVVLYEMLTGVTPFAGENAASVLYKQVYDNPPSLRSINPRIPQELQPVIDRALAKNPSSRYADSLDLARELREVAGWLPPGSPWLRGGMGQGAGTQNGSKHPSQPYNLHPTPGVVRSTVRHETTPRPYEGEVYNGQGGQGSQGSRGNGTRREQPAPVLLPQRRVGRRTSLLIVALLLLGLGAGVLAVAAGVIPIPWGGQPQPSEARFAPPSPRTYTGPLREGNGPDISIPRALLAPLIDGDLSDWEGAAPEPHLAQYTTLEKVEWSGPDDLSASFLFAWDDVNFYVGAVITDDVLVQLPSTRGYNLFRGDDIEMWFDTDLAGDFSKPHNFDKKLNSEDDFQLGLSPGDFGNLPPEAVFWDPTREGERNKLVSVAAQRRPTENGYTLEAAVPWAAFGTFRPQPGNAIGFAASAGDNDKRGTPDQEVMLSTTKGLKWRQPTTLGNLFF